MAHRIYPRDEVQWDADQIEQLLRDGTATAFSTPDGTAYVVKTDAGSFAVRPHQIAKPVAQTGPSEKEIRRAAAVVEAYYTALHGIAENRDGEFTEEERELREDLLAGRVTETEVRGWIAEIRRAQERERREEALRAAAEAEELGGSPYSVSELAEARRAEREGAPLPLAAARRADEDDLLGHFGVEL